MSGERPETAKRAPEDQGSGVGGLRARAHGGVGPTPGPTPCTAGGPVAMLPGPPQDLSARWLGSTRYSPPTYPPLYPSWDHTRARTPADERVPEGGDMVKHAFLRHRRRT